MVSLQLQKAINAEHKERFEALKIFLKQNVDEDADTICNLIDKFSATSFNDSGPVVTSITSTNSQKKTKTKKKISYYNHWMGIKLKELSEKEKNVSEDEKIPKQNRMAFISKQWTEYKNSDDFAWEKKVFDDKQKDSNN